MLKQEINGKQKQLQFLRFFAFLNVFALHIGDWCFINYPTWNGALSAVTFFFMLSGMLTGYSAYGKKVNLNFNSIGRDMWKKIRKMYPLYFLTTMFIAICIGVPTELAHRSETLLNTLVQLAKNLLLVQSWFPEGYFSFNGVGWYLSTLVFLYSLNLPMTVILNRIGKKKRSNEAFTCLILVLVLLTVGYSYITYTDQAHFLQYIFPPARIGQYLIAMIVGYIIRSIKEKANYKLKKSLMFSIFEIVALLLWTVTLQLPSETWCSRLVFWILPNTFLIGIFLFGKGILSEIFSKKPLVLLGDISFECYLTHQIIIFALNGVNPYTNVDRLICIGCALGYTLVQALFINKQSRKLN